MLYCLLREASSIYQLAINSNDNHLQTNNLSHCFICFRDCRKMATATYAVDIECGFCYSRNSAIRNPQTLPCQHVHCAGCLTAFFDSHGIYQCPLANCRWVGNLTLGFLVLSVQYILHILYGSMVILCRISA